MSNDWTAPPYPTASVPTTTVTSLPNSIAITSSVISVASPIASVSSNHIASSTSAMSPSLNGLTPSVYSIASVGTPSEPPPPYEELEGSSTNPIEEVTRHLVKKRDGCTLTEPSDYAMAYKAMQRNQQLPPGMSINITQMLCCYCELSSLDERDNNSSVSKVGIDVCYY